MELVEPWQMEYNAGMHEALLGRTRSDNVNWKAQIQNLHSSGEICRILMQKSVKAAGYVKGMANKHTGDPWFD